MSLNVYLLNKILTFFGYLCIVWKKNVRKLANVYGYCCPKLRLLFVY